MFRSTPQGFFSELEYKVQKISVENITTFNEELNDGVNDGVKIIYKLIQSSPGINTTQILKEIEVSKRTLERWIRELRKRNIIEFKGAPKTGGYYIVSKNPIKN